jgi:hypothetical protein
MAMQPVFRGIFSSANILPSSILQRSFTSSLAPHVIFSAGLSTSVNEQYLTAQSPSQSASVSLEGDRGSSRLSSPPGSPRRHYIPLPSSPFDLTNYDYSAFDNEDGYFESNSDVESENEEIDNNKHGRGTVYSDFNNIVLEPSESVLDDHDSLAAFDTLPFWNRWARDYEDPMEE